MITAGGSSRNLEFRTQASTRSLLPLERNPYDSNAINCSISFLNCFYLNILMTLPFNLVSPNLLTVAETEGHNTLLLQGVCFLEFLPP